MLGNHLNGVSLAGRYWPPLSDIWILPFPLINSIPPILSESAHFIMIYEPVRTIFASASSQGSDKLEHLAYHSLMHGLPARVDKVRKKIKAHAKI